MFRRSLVIGFRIAAPSIATREGRDQTSVTFVNAGSRRGRGHDQRIDGLADSFARDVDDARKALPIPASMAGAARSWAVDPASQVIEASRIAGFWERVFWLD
jgi:hypothetical protein